MRQYFFDLFWSALKKPFLAYLIKSLYQTILWNQRIVERHAKGIFGYSIAIKLLCFLEMKEKYFNGLLPDQEDKVFGAFVLGKYPTEKKFHSTRTDVAAKIVMHN